MTDDLSSDKMRFKVVSRLALAGAIAGLFAAVVDFALAHAGVGAFLPNGALRLLLFLMGLYGVAGAIVGFVCGTLVMTLLAFTDVGLAVAPDHDDRGAERQGARVFAYVLTAPLLLLVGLPMRPIAEAFFIQFHNRMLIASLTGVVVAGLLCVVLLASLLIAPLLSRVLRVGPRVDPALRAPVLALPAIVVALYAAAGFVAVDVTYLFTRTRMSNPSRALNVALASPACAVAGLALGLLAYMALRNRLTLRATPLRALLALIAVLGAPLAMAAVVEWPVVRQLDLRPFGTGVLILVVMAALATRLRARAIAVVVILALLIGATLTMGRIPRVRKATDLTGLAPLLVRGVQLASDLDRDGYSSLLGGGDCNDFNASVHPGAFDWPDDGIDQDCNGHEATLADRTARTYADVPAEVPQQPNVLLITLDALRADHVSSYGYKRQTTPNLDALVKDGIRFDNAWAHAPSTRYSVPAILIGRYPSTIAVNPDSRVHWPPQVLPENRLVSEMLKDLGYHTGATLSYHYFEPGWGLDQGFDDYDYHLYTLHSLGGNPAATSGTSSRQLADLDIEWLKANGNKPFFLWTHFYDTHYMFERHPDLPETNFGNDEEALYDGEIRFADHHIGRVLDTLRELGLYDKTIIIVTSDHGDGFGEHGIPKDKRHGYHLYRTETKVPMLIRVPGLPARVVETPIGHVDIIPTLLNLLRRPASEEPQLFGQSQLAAMLGDDAKKDERAIYQEVWYEGPTSKTALATTKSHLLRNLVPEDTTELYDLVRDPAEEHDLAGEGSSLEASLMSRLGALTDAIAIPLDFAARLKDARSMSPTTPTQALGDELAPYMRVVGVDVEHDTLAPRETAEVTVHFAVHEKIPDGWIVFTHVIGPGGRSMNLDHTPLENLVPIHTLRPGEYIKDPIAISIPADWPDGPVRVELGLYRRGMRAPARGAHSHGDAVTVTTLQVKR